MLTKLHAYYLEVECVCVYEQISDQFQIKMSQTGVKRKLVNPNGNPNLHFEV